MEEHEPLHIEASEKEVWDLVLRQFDIPEARRDISKITNVNWLIRNVRVRNSTNPNCERLIEALKEQFRTLKRETS